MGGALKAGETFPPLFPFVVSHEAPDNAASMSHLLDAPAGKHGFIRVEEGRFATGAGPIRFNGDWGRPPVLAEGIPAEIELAAPASLTRCYALNPNGERVTEVPVEDTGGGSRIVISPQYQTIWYEIEIGSE
jgi:hypothetical protein